MDGTVRRLVVLAAAAAVSATAVALPATPARSQAARSAWRVTIHVDSPTARVGTKVHLTGKVARAAAGKLVMLQERRAGKPWKDQRNALVRRDGTYQTYDVPTDNHTRSYRVVMPATKKHRRGVSRSVQVVVYAWQDLTSLAPVNADHLYEVSSVDINGKAFANSLEASMYDVADPVSQSVEYNLDHRCTKFRGAFGISDDSQTGGRATVSAGADGTSWYSKSFDVGRYEQNAHTWTTAPLKIRFDTTSDNPDAKGLGASGLRRCSAPSDRGTPGMPVTRSPAVTLLLVAGTDFDVEIKQLRATMKTIGQVLDLDGMRAQIADLGEQVAAPDLWDDQDNATRVTGRLSLLQGQLDRFTELDGRIDDVEIMVQLSQEENDSSTLAEAETELGKIHKAVENLEVRTLLSGEYDVREALLTIRSGAGGVDAADFAEMLMRMYTRWAERNKYAVEVFDTSYAEEAGIKSATFAVHAPYAYGTLSVEAGTHRLVRISPFDNQGRRQTSFAAVEVVPVLEQTDEIEIPEEEIRVDVYRSSGPGGQSVNTTDSAVRLTHIPTGIVVSCQNEKSQLQNKASAMVILKAKLLAVKKAEERAELDALRGEVQASWGDQMRNYVLNPYQMVKDLRTDYEVGNPQAVFDGDIDGFLEAGIRWRMGAENTPR